MGPLLTCPWVDCLHGRGEERDALFPLGNFDYKKCLHVCKMVALYASQSALQLAWIFLVFQNRHLFLDWHVSLHGIITVHTLVLFMMWSIYTGKGQLAPFLKHEVIPMHSEFAPFARHD